ncbi:ets DNA-binding protein pokkuri isoform X2 [Zootermopsis nevadensis]|uniref:ets DNA-binding protein pokkuri isoform X2 n=1 Tax=Zootermopsis nevadensis TaxID=136037 RepID=UPI000B8E463A|nr:ets DNA-binding protein pokkuri isoform X2 [Zootermopsis nevadensis]
MQLRHVSERRNVCVTVRMQAEMMYEAQHWEWREPQISEHGPPYLPKDPRSWSRDDVARWLRDMATLHQLPQVPIDRFLMNGKALCLMSMDMFLARVPLGGKLLYKDFQLRLGKAMYTS